MFAPHHFCGGGCFFNTDIMSANCQFINVGAVSECTENYSGIGTSVYVFSGDALAEVEASPEYEDGKAEYTDYSFHNVTVNRIVIKSQSGKITHTSNPNAGGFLNIFTGIVANDMEKMSLMARTMNNLTNWGLLVPDGGGKMYVIYAKDFDLKFELSGDTGDTPDSDHGHTLTVTAGPCRYPFVKWNGHILESNGKFYASYNGSGDIRPWIPDFDETWAPAPAADEHPTERPSSGNNSNSPGSGDDIEQGQI